MISQAGVLTGCSVEADWPYVNESGLCQLRMAPAQKATGSSIIYITLLIRILPILCGNIAFTLRFQNLE